MDKQTIEKNIGRVLEKTEFTNLGQRRQGKVRDIYTQADKIILCLPIVIRRLTVTWRLFP